MWLLATGRVFVLEIVVVFFEAWASVGIHIVLDAVLTVVHVQYLICGSGVLRAFVISLSHQPGEADAARVQPDTRRGPYVRCVRSSPPELPMHYATDDLSPDPTVGVHLADRSLVHWRLGQISSAHLPDLYGQYQPHD